MNGRSVTPMRLRSDVALFLLALMFFSAPLEELGSVDFNYHLNDATFFLAALIDECYFDG